MAPRGTTTRPTSDKVRQAVFNALGSLGLIEGARVLDLFAGSGALGIEALSRGAVHCTFVEVDPAALRTVERNLIVVAPGSHSVRATTVDRFLASNTQRFDFAFIDPPYAFESWPELLAEVPAPFVVIESNRSLAAVASWEIMRSRTYGGTVVTFARRNESTTG